MSNTTNNEMVNEMRAAALVAAEAGEAKKAALLTNMADFAAAKTDAERVRIQEVRKVILAW